MAKLRQTLSEPWDMVVLTLIFFFLRKGELMLYNVNYTCSIQTSYTKILTTEVSPCLKG